MAMKHRVKLDTDVYTEAKKRIRHIINTFDTVLVAFSGGKDSWAALNLVQEVYDELGITEKVKVFFRDEEVIPDTVVNFVDEVYRSGKFDFRYYAIPLLSEKFVLGKKEPYVQWDRNRKWLRQPPEYAITLPPDKYRVFDQYTTDSFVCKGEKGRCAIINGMRADESLMRLQSCVIKRNENYICGTTDPRVKNCKPIYDWSEQDIFLYFYKNKLKYCEIYDAETFNAMDLRVSTPFHAERAKNFSKEKTLNPVYYQQLIDLFPEMILQERYWKDYKSSSHESSMAKYEHSFRGIYRWIDDNLTGANREKAIKVVKSCESNRIKNGDKKNLGAFPVRYVFDQVVNGAYKRTILPKMKPSSLDWEYEGRAPVE